VWFGTNFRLLLHILAAWICANARLLLHLLAAVIVGCLVAGAFFSMFGKHLRGPLESIAAYANYFHRSQQDEHAEPWYYYLQLLFFYWPAKRIFWSEGLIAGLAIIGGVSSFVAPRAAAEAPRSAGVSSDPRLLRFLTFYTLLLTLFYSIIRYKTPWCAMSFLMGMMLLAGAGTTAILRYLPGWPLKTLAAVALVVGAGQLGWQAYESNFDPRWISDPRNPYVYAHTPAPLPRLADRFDRLAQHVPNGHDLRVQVVVPENYWPLPWYLRHFDEKHAGYWLDVNAWLRDRDHLPQPAIVIVAAEVDGEDIAARLAGYDGHVHESLRPGVPITVYIRKDLWEAFLDCR
jgi:predicted membrane-bound mannosyltransferase